MLTDRECRAATRDGGKTKLFDGHGLYFDILRSGTKSRRWRYRFDRTEKRLTFGPYPELSLRAARAKRELAAALLRTGVSPATHRRRAETPQKNAGPTFEAVVLDWHASQTKLFDATHAKKVKRAARPTSRTERASGSRISSPTRRRA